VAFVNWSQFDSREETTCGEKKVTYEIYYEKRKPTSIYIYIYAHAHREIKRETQSDRHGFPIRTSVCLEGTFTIIINRFIDEINC